MEGVIMQTKPKIFKAIAISFVCLILFYLSYFLIYLIIGGAITVLSKLPFIGWIIGMLFKSRGDSPDMMLALLCPTAAYFISSYVILSMEKLNIKTRNIASKILGILLIILNVLAILINLKYVEISAILKNICVTIAGICFFNAGRNSVEN